MIQMTWIPEFIRGVVWIYIAIWAAASIAAWMVPKTVVRRVAALLLTTAMFGSMPALLLLTVKLQDDQQRPIEDQRKAQYDAAMARFEERCKTAGEKIYRTVEDVEGIVWMKWRPKGLVSDQFAMDDPYGHNCGGESCISSMLIDDRMIETSPGSWQPSNARLYSHIDSIVPGEKIYSRFVKRSANAALEKTSRSTTTARYGATWEDISTREDREFWIAGGRMTILDLETNEVIAERTGYLIDRGQGNKANSRNPWSHAFSRDSACPSVREHNVSFITRVLKPKKEGE